MKLRSMTILLVFAALGTFALSACQSTARDVMYSAYEKVGVEKRDLLKKRIENTRDEQKEAGKSFGDALTKLREVYNVDGGELAKNYDKLKTAFDEAEDDAKGVKESIVKVETVAEDLFKEWEVESAEIKTSELRVKSRARLAETRKKYQDLHSALKSAEARMDPVLSKFKDHVLYMKHNLNAQAIASLKGETMSIEKDIKTLIDRMNQSIKEADAFISHLPN